MNINLNLWALACLGFVWLTISAVAQSIKPVYSFTNSSFSSPRNPQACPQSIKPLK